MPPINQAAVSAGVIAVSVAVAAAIALYESPELQRMAHDLRRRIALALHSLGDGVHPNEHDNAANPGEPLFNRPEDAEGFLASSADMDADDETRRRQRAELLHWNAVKLAREQAQAAAEKQQRRPSRQGPSPTTFEAFLQEDKTADEKGTYVYNSGADARPGSEQQEGTVVRRRGQAPEGVRGLSAAVYANPFADEHGIDLDEHLDDDDDAAATNQISPDKDEIDDSDCYNATPRERPSTPVTQTMTPDSLLPALISEPLSLDEEHVDVDAAALSPTESATEDNESTTAPHSDVSHDAYAAIQAWAHQQQQQQRAGSPGSPGPGSSGSSGSSAGGLDFYSPLPVTPHAPRSEMSDGELVSEGQLTPTDDTASVAGSGVDVALAHDAASQASSSSAAARLHDVLSEFDSEDSDGVATPAHSWSEVGSVVSESEDRFQHAARV